MLELASAVAEGVKAQAAFQIPYPTLSKAATGQCAYFHSNSSPAQHTQIGHPLPSPAKQTKTRKKTLFDCHQSTLVDIVHLCPTFQTLTNFQTYTNSQLTCRQSTPVLSQPPVIQKQEQVTYSHPHLWNTVFLPNCLDRQFQTYTNSQLTCRQSTPVLSQPPVIQKQEQVTYSHPHLWNTVFLPNCLDRQLLHKQTKLPQRHVHKRASNKCPSTSLKPSLFFHTC